MPSEYDKNKNELNVSLLFPLDFLHVFPIPVLLLWHCSIDLWVCTLLSIFPWLFIVSSMLKLCKLFLLFCFYTTLKKSQKIFYLYSVSLEIHWFPRYLYSMNGVRRTFVNIRWFPFGTCIEFILITNGLLRNFPGFSIIYTLRSSYQQLPLVVLVHQGMVHSHLCGMRIN